MNVLAMPVSTWNILIRMRDLIIRLLECSASHAFDRRHHRPHRRLLVGVTLESVEGAAAGSEPVGSEAGGSEAGGSEAGFVAAGMVVAAIEVAAAMAAEGLAAAMGSGSSPEGTTVEGVFGGVACSAGCAAFTAASA